MPKYVDGYVLVIPKKNVKAYQAMARGGQKLWMDAGALGYFECMGDDLHPKMEGGKITSFPEMARLKKGETVWFSFITFKSRKHRDQVNKKVYKQMGEMAEKYKDMKMPFDPKRMAYGGFKVMVRSA